MRLQAKTLSFQRNRSATCERVQNRRNISACRLYDLFVRLIEEFFVVDIFPLDKAGDEPMKAFPFDLLVIFCREFFRVR